MPSVDFKDVVAVVGLGLVSYGTWLVYEPAAFIVAGALMLVGSALMAARS